jgi:predicted short-subunit dehydrogenase-like oxidoreductase (DUF2520 family)
MDKFPSVVIIGAGKLATQLGKILHKKGFPILQVYSHTIVSAKLLGEKINVPYTNELSQIISEAEVYIYAVKDSAIEICIEKTPKNKGLHIHTAGSVPMSVFAKKKENYGVLYPLQTFSKERNIDFKKIPIFIEANSKQNELFLNDFAHFISNQVKYADSEQRKNLHLAAVFACNFVNHLYAIAEKLLAEKGIPFDNLLPLINETATKIQDISPKDAQTGPAVRFDKNSIQKHLDALNNMPNEQTIYKLLSENIFRYTHEK